MRKPVLASLVIFAPALVLPRPSAAQEARIDAGVKGGLNFSSLPVNLPDGNIYTGRLHTGLAGGGFVVFPVTHSLTIEADALVLVKGTRDGSEHIKLTYLDIPVLVRFVNVSYGHAMLHAYIGPSFAFKLAASDNLSPLSGSVFGGGVADHTKAFDPGLTVGGEAAGRHLIGDFRYTWGFSDIRDLTPKIGTAKNRSLTVMIGYRFGG